MQVLLTLAKHGNHVVLKEELMTAVWPDTFVSDDVLTRCVSILRRVTQDNSHTPHFIQTVPKKGYRLLAPVMPIHSERAQPGIRKFEEPPSRESFSPSPVAVLLSPQTSTMASPGRQQSRGPLLAFMAILTGVLILGGLRFFPVFAGFFSRGQSRVLLPASFKTTQFTAYAGEQTQPVFSPDGSRIAYVGTSEDGRSQRVYIKQIGLETAVELTPGSEGRQFSPAWSPDGKVIAYLVRDKAGLGIDIASVNGAGRSRRVYVPQEPSHWEQGALAWAPDGKTLIFPDHAGSEPSSSIYALDLRSGRARSLTTPPRGWEGDLTPAFSPDGKRIAFTRASETAVRDIYWFALADGRLHALTHDRKAIDSLTWSADDRSILFSSNRGGKYALWSIGTDSELPQRLPVGTEDAFEPSVGPKPGQLAYVEGSAIWSIVRVRQNTGNVEPEPLLTSTQQDSAPSLSPDGRLLSFQSLRSGSQEIWVASMENSTLRQLTFAGGPLTGSPAWSHHGDRIAFDSRPDGHSHIFAVPADGGKPLQLTFGDANDIVPRWSHDDRDLYYRSNRGGSWQVWKIAAAGGEPQLVSGGDGIEPQESSDGRWLYYARGEDDGLWRIPVGGTSEMRVLSDPAGGYWGYWQLMGGRLFYLDLANGRPKIRVTDLPLNGICKPGSIFAELSFTPPRYAGLAVADDGKAVLVTEERAAGRHITLVQPQ